METVAGETFIRAGFSMTTATAKVRVLKEVRFQDGTTLKGKEIASNIRSSWRSHWRLQIFVAERSTEGLPKAPDFAEVRAARRH